MDGESAAPGCWKGHRGGRGQHAGDDRRQVHSGLAGLFGGVGSVAAQAPTPADTAAVLLDAARDFESRGRREVAEALYQLLVDRYPSTVAGSEAVAMLARGRSGAQDGNGRVELQVWGTLYGKHTYVTIGRRNFVEGVNEVIAWSSKKPRK